MNFVKVKARTGEDVYINLALARTVKFSGIGCTVFFGGEFVDVDRLEDAAKIRVRLDLLENSQA